MKVCDALRRFLNRWKTALPENWRATLCDVELDFENRSLDKELWGEEIIIPEARNVFRALADIDPGDARAIILGQDPYPNPRWATGRAFEQGDLTEWPEDRNRIADSLARIVQTLAFARAEDRSYVTSDRSWNMVIRDLRRGALKLEPPPELFDHLRRQGVMFLNASLTLGLANGAKRRRSHFALWRPLIERVLTHIATRPAGYAVFLLWGRHAKDIFDRAGVQSAAEHAGTWKKRVDTARHFHPAAITTLGPEFLRAPNPFLAANELLRRMGAPTIQW